MATYYLDVGLGSSNPNWAASTAYSTGDIVCPLTHGGTAAEYVYEVTDDGGTSGGTEPTWVTTPGSTTTDNNITWTCREPDSWAEALNHIQDAFNKVAAGDTVYCRGTQVLTAAAQLAANGTSGSYIYFIGCNSSGTDDGTRFTLDGNDGAFDIFDPNTYDMTLFSNFRFTNSGQDGLDNSSAATTSAQLIFNNCSFDNNAGIGINAAATTGIYIRCCIYGNTGDGVDIGTTSNAVAMYFCSIHDNGGHGFDSAGYSVGFLFGCLIYDNGTDGIYAATGGSGSALVNTVIDGNTDDGLGLGSAAVQLPIFGCRITNHPNSAQIGLDVSSPTRGCIVGWNYLENNYGDNIQVAASSMAWRVPVNGSDTNVEDQSNTNQGYTSLTDGSEDFNLRSDASLRRTAVPIPLS